MIPQETVAKILDAAQIVEVVSDFVSLKRKGASWSACCPFHNEKTPSFYVFPSSGRYKCFGCGKGGTAIGFVMDHESLTYPEALRYLAKKYGIEIVEKEETPEEIAARQKSESLYIVSEFAHKFFVESLSTKEGRDIGFNYFRSRSLEEQTIVKYGLGWAPKDREALPKAALAQGYKKEYLLETGLCVEYDGRLLSRFYDRVVFPFHSVSGRILGFGARTLRTDFSAAGIGKYVNSSDSEIYHKRHTLYGIWFAKGEMSKRDKCYMVEGYLDVLSMHQLGITNVVASSGTSLTEEQVKLVKKFTRNMTIMYDGDSAGIHAAIRGLGLVLKEGMNVKIVQLPQGEDPDSYARTHTRDEVEAYICDNEKDFISFKTNLLLSETGDDPIKKAELINDIADTIALVPDAIQRSVYVQSTAATFGLDQQVIFARIQRVREKMLEDEKKAYQRKKASEGTRSSSPQYSPAPVPGEIPPPTYPDDIPPYDYPPMEGPLPQDAQIPQTGGTLFEEPYLAPNERDLVWFLLNDGMSRLCFESDSEYYDPSRQSTVAEFISGALSDDSLENSVYRNVYNDYLERYYKYDVDLVSEDEAKKWNSEIVKAMMDSPDRTTADIVADLTQDRYQLTVQNFVRSMTSKATMLVRHVPRAILLYHLKRLVLMNREYLDQLKTTTDPEEIQNILRRVQKISQKRKILDERLGRIQ